MVDNKNRNSLSLHFGKKQIPSGYSRQIKAQTLLPFSANEVTTVPFSFGQYLEKEGTTEPKGKQGFYLWGGGKQVGKREKGTRQLLNKGELHRVTYPLEVNTTV